MKTERNSTQIPCEKKKKKNDTQVNLMNSALLLLRDNLECTL